MYLGPNFTQQMHCLSSFQSSGGGGDGVGRGGGGIHRWSSGRTTSNQSTETHRQKIRYVRRCSRSVKQGGRRDTKSLNGSTHTARRGKLSEPMIHCCSTKVVLLYLCGYRGRHWQRYMNVTKGSIVAAPEYRHQSGGQAHLS